MLELLLAAWILTGATAFGPAAFIFLYMRRSAGRSWPTKIDTSYKPRISIIVPTYNESRIIRSKLINLSRVEYPRELLETLVVDSNSSDSTAEIVQQFCDENPDGTFKLIVEKVRKGKSHALNYALSQCTGEVIVVSDADCFWPSDILENAVPFLADPSVGVVTGPKVLLNADQTWVTRMEELYLQSANSLRLGEAKAGSTVIFEGGFAAFKKNAFDCFDPYKTGSDDCGTGINVIEKRFRVELIPNAWFYSTFPSSFRNRISIKLRRINQLIRVFGTYLTLLVEGRMKSSKVTVVPNTLLYLFSPSAFIAFMVFTGLFAFVFPYVLFILLLFLVPKVSFFAYQIVENNLLLFVGLLGVAAGRKFSVWSQPEDREWLTMETLNRFNLL